MKRIFFLGLLLLSGIGSQVVTAQARLNFNIQPQWGPQGYDYVSYYYLPDVDAFYNVPKQQYIYLDRGRWIHANSLPVRNKNFNIYKGYKVVVNEPSPYLNAKKYRTKYASFKGNSEQIIIRNSSDSRYFVNKKHPKHQQWLKEKNHVKHTKSNGNIKSVKNNNSNKKHKGHK